MPGGNQQQSSRQQAADAKARQLPPIGSQTHTYGGRQRRLLPCLRGRIGLPQRRQQIRNGIEDDQRGGAQRPVPRLPLEQIRRLHQKRHGSGGSRPEAWPFIQAGGAERGVGAEDENGGGGMAQTRLKVQKKKSAQSGAQQRTQPGPPHADSGNDSQRPWAVQTVQRTAGKEKSGGSR